jgi:hypothetical protein
MQKKTALLVVFLFSLIGVLFSGYLTLAKFIGTKCIIAEGCSYFLGYPTCVYGFVMYLILLALSSYILFMKPENENKPVTLLLAVSLIGIAFSLYFSAIEAPLMGTIQYTLFFPTCVYGFFMYLIVFLAAYFGLYRK